MINYSPATRLHLEFEVHNFQEGKEAGIELLKEYLLQGENIITRFYLAEETPASVGGEHEWDSVPFIARGFFQVKSDWYGIEPFNLYEVEGSIGLDLCCGVGSIQISIGNEVRKRKSKSTV
ncbi:hypothetical protein NSR00_17655 [Aeribacillus sp. FSL K6-8394]|uniref:hypothetical protein n=1 Tax=Aeribacillus sp. FSL K6-8394 TaxID=2954570 RepID=UPI0030F4B3EF